jgi:di/tricarboxylate transporter
MLALMIQGKFRADFIALSALLILSLTGILTPEEALAGFSNPVVIMLASLFIVGAGIVNSGLVDYIGKILIFLGKGSEVKLIILVMFT